MKFFMYVTFYTFENCFKMTTNDPKTIKTFLHDYFKEHSETITVNIINNANKLKIWYFTCDKKTFSMICDAIPSLSKFQRKILLEYTVKTYDLQSNILNLYIGN